jgi:hypothetical protein
MSSEARSFFRAQGLPVTLELPLPVNSGGIPQANRTLVLSRHNSHSFDSEYQITEMTNRLGLHRLPGPFPSVDMLLVELLDHIKSIHCFLPLGRPLAHGTWRFLSSDAWLSTVDNPLWGNNAEASSSANPRRSRLQLIRTSGDNANGISNLVSNVQHHQTNTQPLELTHFATPVATSPLPSDCLEASIVSVLDPHYNSTQASFDQEMVIDVVEVIVNPPVIVPSPVTDKSKRKEKKENSNCG